MEVEKIANTEPAYNSNKRQNSENSISLPIIKTNSNNSNSANKGKTKNRKLFYSIDKKSSKNKKMKAKKRMPTAKKKEKRIKINADLDFVNKLNMELEVDELFEEESRLQRQKEKIESNPDIISKRLNIRGRILNIEGEIATSDRLMVVKNNYYWTVGNDSISFIANGDMAEIRKIKHFEEMYGFRFADVELSFTDYPDAPNIETKILLDTLNSNSASLTTEESQSLFAAIEEDYMDIPNRRLRYKEMRKNPWFNALQVKFAYALTCHKTQGGQWNTVFIDSAFNQKETLETEDLRWIYTALTRAQQRVFFVNFKEEFFG